MQYNITIAMLLMLALAVSVAKSGENDSCGNSLLSTERRSALAVFVQEFLRVPFPLVLEENVHIREQDCMYRLRFTATQKAYPFEFVFYMSQDGRFLGDELLDLSKGPEQSRVAQERDAWEIIARGRMPERGASGLALIVSFEDLTCPYSKRAGEWLRRAVLAGRARTAFRFQVLNGSLSWRVAEVAACALMQSNEAFWVAHDSLYARQEDILAGKLDPEVLVSGLHEVDSAVLRDCLAAGSATRIVGGDVKLARLNGISRSPTVLVAGKRIEGFSETALAGIVAARGQSGETVGK